MGDRTPARLCTRRRGLRTAMLSAAGALGPAGLLACGGSRGHEGGTPAAVPVTISFSTDWVAGPRGDIMKQALAMFAERYPRITVDRTDLGGSGVQEKFAAAFATGTHDDVVLVGAPQLPYYRDLGAFVDLAPYLKAAKIDTRIYAYLDPAHSAGNKRFFLPFQLGGAVWSVNKTLFRQAGVPLPNENWTWSDMADAARRLTKLDANQYGLGPALTPNLQVSLLPLMGSNGGHHISADFKQTQMLHPATLETIRWAADRIQRDRSWVPPGVPGVSFNNGNVAMAWGNTGGVGNSIRALADKFEWDLMPPPRAPRTGKALRTYNQQPHGITTKPTGGAARVEAAFTFVTFMAGRDVQLLVAKDRGSTPVLRELVGSSPYTDPPPESMSLIAKGLDHVLDIRLFNGYEEWQQAYGGALMDIWSGKVSADAGAKLANEAGDAVLARLARK